MSLERLPDDELFLKRRGLRRELSLLRGLQPVRIAVLGGSTTNELVDLLEVLLLDSGFQPVFYQSEYGRYFEEAVLDSSRLIEFRPDIVYLHTSYRDVLTTPSLHVSEAAFASHVAAELARYRQIWQAIERNLPAQIIQNNFETPPFGMLGNLDAAAQGPLRFFAALNTEFGRCAADDPRLLLQDVHSLSARIGLGRWFDWDRYFSYKILTSPEASVALARSLASMVRALYGKSRKVLVLDLDNTLWGGVIGEDGVEGIQIGRETAVAEAYTAFQEYCLALYRRGILLAVCSKNDEEIARLGFSHPDCVLKLEHIACFKANWQPKHENLQAIAEELNLAIESFVFVDDNPAERALVAAQIEGIAVPEIGTEVSKFPAILEAGRYFEAAALSGEDVARGASYQANAGRLAAQAHFSTYGDYLDSLEMTAEIDRFTPLYLERIAQLTNKTNQFNLTTRRYSAAEVEAIARDGSSIALYGRLRDRFGDHGLVSVVLGRRERNVLHLDLWLMSCRVLKREMELAMFDELVEQAKAAGVRTLLGYFLPTRKNQMVANHYEQLGFALESRHEENGSSIWSLEIASHIRQNRYIQVVHTMPTSPSELVHA